MRLLTLSAADTMAGASGLRVEELPENRVRAIFSGEQYKRGPRL
jgi:hypothetical protein